MGWVPAPPATSAGFGQRIGLTRNSIANNSSEESAPSSRAEVEKICAEHGLESELDQFGNILVRLRTDGAQRPFVLAAHMDHPGFEIIRPLPKDRWLARFQGGVSDSYFRAGIPVRLMPGA